MTGTTRHDIQPEAMQRAIRSYRAADDLCRVPADAVQQKGGTALRVEGYVWLSICMAGAFFSILVAVYEAAGGWHGEAGVSVVLALVFTYLTHRVLTEIRKRNHRHGRGS